jgi:hypothetical protein
MNTLQQKITLGNKNAWLVIMNTQPRYTIIQLDMFPVSNILFQLEPFLNTIKNIYDIPRNSYGISYELCQQIHTGANINKCGIMTLNIGFNLMSCPRDYDIYEEIYMGTITNRNIPTHYLVYIELTMDEHVFYIAIEPSIRSKSNTIQIFVENTYDRLNNLIDMRYTPRNMHIIY